ncbi:MAG: MOSC domain-containing protein [Candidatus Hydrogenedentes bacterium]|nr:MOSC domain-containing protein [Candidatus Hydrogenedentota bacterium]
MKLLSVNVSQAKTVAYHGRQVATGIYKEAIAGRVRVGRLTIDGDRQVDFRVHGGVDKAVYAYPHEHYAVWQEELGRDDFAFGQFGENLTTQGLLEDAVHIGDRFRIGDALFEVSQPRVPCFKLAMKMEDNTIPKRLIESQRCGFYLRVIEEGEIGAGDAIDRVTEDPMGVSVQYIYNLYFNDKDNKNEIARMLDHPHLSGEWKQQFRDL